MALRATYDYVVLAHNLDFGAILAATRGEKPSVVQIRSEGVSRDVVGAMVVWALRKIRLRSSRSPPSRADAVPPWLY